MNGLTRRRFLLYSGVTGAAALATGATVVTWNELAAGAAARPLPPNAGVLVVVTMYGGNDGLNTVIPIDDAAYHTARPDLGFADGQPLDLGDGLGLNPSMPDFHSLWTDKHLAIVRGVGYPNPILSHFSSMDIWQTASPTDPTTTGWLGRWLDAAEHDPLKAVAVGPVLPPLLAGSVNSGASLPLTELRPLHGRLGDAFTHLGGTDAGEPPLQAEAARSDADLVAVTTTCGPALTNAKTGTAKPTGTATGTDTAQPTPTATPTGGSGDATARAGGLADQLAIVAACINARVPTRVYAVDVSSFDTHSAEKTTQDNLLGEVDSAVGGFLRDIAASPSGANTVVLMYSEFGRRVAQNANQGTDHGTAGPVFLAGTPVAGGFYGDQPSLTNLDDGNLIYNVDFRSVYATLLQNVLSSDPEQVLGQNFPTLNFV